LGCAGRFLLVRRMETISVPHSAEKSAVELMGVLGLCMSRGSNRL
jgi:hypothetical protein